jgi:hypothetical protein
MGTNNEIEFINYRKRERMRERYIESASQREREEREKRGERGERGERECN